MKMITSGIAFDSEREIERIMMEKIQAGVPNLKVLVAGVISPHVEEAGLCLQVHYVCRGFRQEAVRTNNFKVVAKCRPQHPHSYRVDLYPEEQKGYPHARKHDAFDQLEDAVVCALNFIEAQADKILTGHGL